MTGSESRCCQVIVNGKNCIGHILIMETSREKILNHVDQAEEGNIVHFSMNGCILKNTYETLNPFGNG